MTRTSSGPSSSTTGSTASPAPLTRRPAGPGDSYSYVFVLPHRGTYFYRSHRGLQLDRRLHARLSSRDPEDADDQDVEGPIVLDDWIDGITGTPDDQLATLTG